MMEYLAGLANTNDDPGNSDPTGAYLGNMIDPATAKQFQMARAQQGLLGLSQGLLAGNGRVGQTFGDGLAAGLQSMMTQQNALPGQALQSAQANSAMGAGLLNRAQAASTLQEMEDVHKLAAFGPQFFSGNGSSGDGSTSAPKSFADQNAPKTGGITGSGVVTGGTADIGTVLSEIRKRESGGFQNPYGLTPQQNVDFPNSHASGAYQFQPATWREWTKKSGIGQEYDEAYKAPADIQDKVAAFAATNGPGVNHSSLWGASAKRNPYPEVARADAAGTQGVPSGPSVQAQVAPTNQGQPASTLKGDASRVEMASAPPGMVKINSKGVPYAAEMENMPPEEKAKQAEAYAAIKQAMAAGAPPPQVPEANRQFGGLLPGANTPAGGPAPAPSIPQGGPQGIVNFGGGGQGPVGVGPNGYQTYTPTPNTGAALLPPGMTQDKLNAALYSNYVRGLYKRPTDPYIQALGTYGLDLAKARNLAEQKGQIDVDTSGPMGHNKTYGELTAQLALSPQVEAAKTGAINSTNNQLGVAGNPVWETHPITIGGKTIEMSAPKFKWNQGIQAVIEFNQGQSQPGPGTMVPPGAPVGGPPAATGPGPAAMPPATGPAPMVAPQPAPAGPRPMLPLPPAPAVGAGGPAVSDRPFIGKPSYTPQQESEQKGVGDKLAAQRQEIMDQGATAQAANVNLFNMRQAAQDLYTGKGGEAFAELTKYLRLVDPKWNGSVTKAETFVKDGGNLLRQAVKDTSSRAAVQEYKLIGETLPTLATSPQGIQTLLGELQGFNDYKFAKAKAMDSWLADPTHQGSIAGFETQFHQTLNPYTFIALRMSPEDLGQMVTKLSGTDAGKRAISKLTADMNFVKENKLEPDM